ncbi:MAG: response regulator [Saprospiraceae bacterium]|nr:response regulator [Saprospiraceae bacterium]
MEKIVEQMSVNSSDKVNYTLRSTLYGTAFGLTFPAFATVFDILYLQDLPISWEQIIRTQMESPLHWVIDTAPFVLGFVASLVGRKQQKLVRINQQLESIVRNRTQSLEEKNSMLVREIDERIQIEKELIEAKDEAIRARSAEEAFLANMSHEIRTPMNGIVGFVDLLGQSELQDEQREYVASIRHSTSHLLAIINDILDMSKIKTGRIEFEKTEIDLRELMRNLINSLRVSASAKGIEVIDELDSRIPQVVIGDPIRLSQIILNLANNAIKFTHEGHVRVVIRQLSATDQHVSLSFQVEDTGIGIPSHQLENIFKEFSQADSSTARKYGGTGLGLSISKKLVELQGGKIEVVSEVNVGSVFSFSLKFDLLSVSRPKANEIQFNRRLPEGSKIMVVDDNRMNRVLATKILERGANTVLVEMVENGRDAVRLLEEEDFDIILLDLQMPVMDGFQTCKYIREKLDSPKRDIPIIALTADALPQEKIKALEVGMNEYIIKPFRKEELYSKINLLLEYPGKKTKTGSGLTYQQVEKDLD